MNLLNYSVLIMTFADCDITVLIYHSKSGDKKTVARYMNGWFHLSGCLVTATAERVVWVCIVMMAAHVTERLQRLGHVQALSFCSHAQILVTIAFHILCIPLCLRSMGLSVSEQCFKQSQSTHFSIIGEKYISSE